MNIQPIKTRIFQEGEGLIQFIHERVPKIKNNSILAVTSKIVALSENRTVIVSTKKDKEKLIKQESQWALKTKYVWATLKDGMLVASAGIDESNANGKLILLPKDSFLAASRLRQELRRIYKIKNLGIIITDSRIAPLRSGVLGVALGYAGFAGLRNYIGTKDIFGRRLKYSKTNIADSLATACTVVMGEGREQLPLAIITEPPVQFVERVRKNELKIDIRLDMYGPLFKASPNQAKI